MNKLSKDKRDRLILVGTITLIIIVALWFLVIGGQRDTLQGIASRTQQLSAAILKAEVTYRGGTNVEKSLGEHAEALKLKESEMAPEDDPYAWMQVVMKRACQGRLDGWQLDKPEFRQWELMPGSSYRFAIFHFKGSGFFPVIGKFIADFENTHRLFQVRNLVITPASSMPMIRSGAAAPGDDEMLAVDFLIVTPVRPAASQPIAP